MRRAALLFWWFLLFNGGATPVTIGPFYDLPECNAIRLEAVSLPIPFYANDKSATGCWYDEQQDTLRR